MKILTPIYKSLEEADSRGELIPCLLSLDRRIRSQECGPVLCELHNAGKISLVSGGNLAAIEALPHNDFWSVIHPLDQAIPELNCSLDDALMFVQTLVRKAGADGASGMPNSSLVKWCKANPEKAMLIVERAKSLDEICVSHCVFALQGLENIDLSFELVGHSDKIIVSVGLRSLGSLKIESDAIAKRVVDKCCEIVAAEKDRKVRSSAIEAAFNTWKKIAPSEAYRQKELLGFVIREKNDDELIQLSAALFYHLNGLVPESIDQILEALAGDVSHSHELLHLLDSALHFKNERWNFKKVVDIFAKHIPKLKSPVEPRQFNNFSQWALADPANADQLFSSWLADGNHELCKYLADMIVKGGKENTVIEISMANLPSEVDDQVFMARKCVGFLWLHEVTAASVLLSIVKNGKKSAQQEAESLLYNPLLLSFSGALREFLEGQIGNSSKRISDCVRRLIKSHDAYLAGLKKAEHLLEFLPTIEQRRVSEMKDRERNNDIQSQAHERSVFSQFVARQTLLYGNKSFFVAHGEGGQKIPNIMQLSEFSYSIEFPRLGVIDPVGFHEMLTIFRVERKVSR